MRDLMNNQATVKDCKLCDNKKVVKMLKFMELRTEEQLKSINDFMYPAVFLPCPLCSDKPSFVHYHLQKCKELRPFAYDTLCQLFWIYCYTHIDLAETNKLMKYLFIEIDNDFQDNYISYYSGLKEKVKDFKLPRYSQCCGFNTISKS